MTLHNETHVTGLCEWFNFRAWYTSTEWFITRVSIMNEQTFLFYYLWQTVSPVNSKWLSAMKWCQGPISILFCTCNGYGIWRIHICERVCRPGIHFISNDMWCCGLKCYQLITMKFCTRQDSATVVKVANVCDRRNILWKKIQTFTKFRIWSW